MQSMITYPLYDLDMSEHVPFKDPNTCYLYDLYGVVVSIKQTLSVTELVLNVIKIKECVDDRENYFLCVAYRITLALWVAGTTLPR